MKNLMMSDNMFIFSSVFWFFVALVIAILYFILFRGKAFIHSKGAWINYKSIFTIVDSSGKSVVLYRHLLFYILFPLVLAISSNLGRMINDSLLEMIGVIAAILTAMLYIFIDKIESKTTEIIGNKESMHFTVIRAEKLRNETIGLVMCEIYMSVALLIICLMKPMLGDWDFVFFSQVYSDKLIILSVQSILSFFIYYLFYTFTLNLLIATKRFYQSIE